MTCYNWLVIAGRPAKSKRIAVHIKHVHPFICPYVFEPCFRLKILQVDKNTMVITKINKGIAGYTWFILCSTSTPKVNSHTFLRWPWIRWTRKWLLWLFYDLARMSKLLNPNCDRWQGNWTISLGFVTLRLSWGRLS